MSEQTEEKAWEKCARKLMLNNPNKLDAFHNTIKIVLTNIINNDNVSKYRYLKHENTIMKQNILQIKGGLEFLQAIGFRTISVSETNEKVLFLQDANISSLNDSMEWLENTVLSCKFSQVTQLNAIDNNTMCAECTIQIKLPNESIIQGGFLKSDTMNDVRSFAACYFVDSRASAVNITLPGYSGDSQCLLLNSTLEELGMFPRATVIACAYSEQEQDMLLTKNHFALKNEEENKIKSIRSEKKAKQDTRKIYQAERTRILSAFRDDHHS